MELNPMQAAAVAHRDGPLLVLAGAGSGKTRVITHRIAALLKSGVPAHSLLALTFTNKAAREMRSRAQRLAGSSLDGATLSTFHSVCARWLRAEGSRLGLTRAMTIVDDEDQLQILRRLTRTMALPHDSGTLRHYRQRIDEWRHDGASPAQAVERAIGREAEEEARLYQRYEDTLRASNSVDFGGLIAWTLHLLEHEDDLREQFRERYRYVMVDEFQDTDVAQYRLLRALVPDDGNITVVGDDDQSIYGWRGASVENVGRFTEDYRDVCIVKLEQNYRSSPQILETAHAVVESLPDRMPKRLFTTRSDGPRVRLFIGRNDREEAEWVAGEIHRLRREHGLSFDDMAVFYRTNAQSRVLEERLRAAGTDHRIIGGVSFYERREVRDVLAYLQLAVNPLDDNAFFRVVNTPSRGVGRTTIELLDQARRGEGLSLLAALGPFEAAPPSRLNRRTREGLRQFRDTMAALQMAAHEGRVDEALDVLLVETGYLETLAASRDPDAEDRIRNVEELRHAAVEFAMHAPSGATGVVDFLESITLRGAADTVLEDGGEVQLMTVHMAKGLEFPVVFVTGLEDGRFPLRSRLRPTDEDEERRLFYVAVTRAREHLILTAAAERRLHGQTRPAPLSPFVSLLPDDQVEAVPGSARPGSAPGTHTHGRRSAAWDEFDQRPAPERIADPVRQVPVEGIVFDDRHYPEERVADAQRLVGRSARHRLFGTGTVTGADPSGSRIRLTIDFPGVGEKRVILDYVELD
ncbi:MAG: hypothetical protein EA398_07850 [Deltaproteobacteria bacterium]|nr:MAG: hypothetical protein EA398_07850 [Deltaproteobacteria bacterium]